MLRLIRRSAFVLVLAVACGGACGGGKPATVAKVPVDPIVHMAVPAESTLKNDPFSVSVRRGRALLRATRDSLPRNVNNRLRCVSCHLDDGSRAFAMPWTGVYARFPQYRSRSGKV